MPPQKLETLEVEDEDERLKRIQITLEKLNNSTSSPPPTNSPIQLPAERSKPHAVPPSDLLSRVQAFLPALEASNALLEQRRQADPSSVDIENVQDGAERYIEMNLGLGLFEQRKGAGSGENSSSESDTSSSDTSDSDPDDESEDAEDSMDVEPKLNPPSRDTN